MTIIETILIQNPEFLNTIISKYKKNSIREIKVKTKEIKNKNFMDTIIGKYAIPQQTETTSKMSSDSDDDIETDIEAQETNFYIRAKSDENPIRNFLDESLSMMQFR